MAIAKKNLYSILRLTGKFICGDRVVKLSNNLLVLILRITNLNSCGVLGLKQNQNRDLNKGN